MESPRKFNDCYFYYYSTCTKGDNCVFRHEPSALGCEMMCTAWQQGKCLDKRCKLRHMELRKNRKQIPCYWENQPGGCRKMHCPFMHKNPEARTDGIAPSQPAPAGTVQQVPGPVPAEPPVAERPLPPSVAAPPPAPVPLLWQQQRQSVLDSALLGVLPGAGGGALVARRTLAVEDGNPYAPLAVDPLVVNFEEESDNESAPSSTPTKCPPDDAQRIARTKSQELLLLEKIQAEAAAFYNYDNLPPAPEPQKERKIVRPNPATKYDRLSLDELAGKQASTERRKSLDFKVLSLDEIRARKKTTIETVVPTAPITLKLSRKRKSSMTETLTTTGNKILKVVRSNSVVYKKIDKNAPPQSSQSKHEHKPQEVESRKRTLSEQTDLIYDMQEDELVDNCFEFKRIKITEKHNMKPVIIRNKQSSIDRVDVGQYDDADVSNKIDNDSDTEVQIVSVDIPKNVNIDDEIIDLDDSKTSDVDDVVDLSEDDHVELVKNVPDIVASCQKNASKGGEVEHTVSDIDEDTLLNDDDDL